MQMIECAFFRKFTGLIAPKDKSCYTMAEVKTMKLRKLAALGCLLCMICLLFAGCPAVAPIPETTAAPAQTTTEAPSEEVVQPGQFQITFLDVGQADCAVVCCDGLYMVIDAGNKGDSDLIYSYLTRNGIDNIEYCLLTHYHEDHIGGAQAVPRAAKVGTLLVNGAEFESQIAQDTTDAFLDAGVPIQTVSAGDELMLGSARIQILGPVKLYDNTNDTSIVLRIVYGNTAFLFTGDAEVESEHDILDAGFDISCDVLKVGHHGSDSSTSYLWLRQSMPEYAIISVGQDNTYGHPHQEVVSRLEDAGVAIYRTDLLGDIICTSDGRTVTITSHRYTGTVEVSKDYVLNTSSMKYHEPGCSSVEDIAENNRKDYTGTAKELQAMGYAPCGRCDPT